MKIGVLALLGGVAVMGLSTLTGCETLVQTPGENWNMVAHSGSTNLKQVPDDAERILLIDRGSWLSSKPVPQN